MRNLILVIDDSEFDRKITSQVLLKGDFEVVTAAGGTEALQRISVQKPSLVILDRVMQDKSGIDVLKEIRKSFSALELPVIMISSKSDASDIIEALQSGANDYLGKPINSEVTLRRVQTQLQLVELSRTALPLKELEAISAIITTYNHEINNPLSIALVTAERLLKTHHDPVDCRRLEEALRRIAEIVKKVTAISTGEVVEYMDYTVNTKMVKLK